MVLTTRFKKKTSNYIANDLYVGWQEITTWWEGNGFADRKPQAILVWCPISSESVQRPSRVLILHPDWGRPANSWLVAPSQHYKEELWARTPRFAVPSKPIYKSQSDLRECWERREVLLASRSRHRHRCSTTLTSPPPPHHRCHGQQQHN